MPYTQSPGFLWFPLPSRIWKVFKCSHLISFYYPKENNETAWLYYLGSLATQLKGYCLPPILSAFYKRFAKYGNHTSSIPISWDWHIPKSDMFLQVIDLPLVHWASFFYTRYKMSYEELDEAQNFVWSCEVGDSFPECFNKLLSDYT